MSAPKRPACRRCGSTRHRQVNSMSDDRGTVPGPLCFDEYRCGQRAAERRIARAVEALDPYTPWENGERRWYVVLDDVLAAVRGRRG